MVYYAASQAALIRCWWACAHHFR